MRAKIFFLILSFLTSVNLFATLAQDLQNKPESRWSCYTYVGYAWSRNAGIFNPDPQVFANVAPGDTDNGSLSNTPYVGVSLQRNIRDWISVGFSYELYALWNYQRYHVRGNPLEEMHGGKYIRQFLMNHQSFIVESYLVLPQDQRLLLKSVSVTPLIGLGAGVGINNLFNFGTIGDDPVVNTIGYYTVGSDFINKSLAWRAELGLKFDSLYSNFAFGVSYRYYDGGTLQSGKRYQFNGSFDVSTLKVLPPWSGTLRANEIKLFLEVDFD